MNDQEVWEQAVVTTRNLYNGISPETLSMLAGHIDEIARLKQKLVEIVTSAGSADVCRSCGGECCRRGKYYVTVLDIMAYLKSGVEPVTPNFNNNSYCPYSDNSGCTMSAGFRPMTCVVFNCQLVEDLLSPAQIEIALEYEKELRAAIRSASDVSGLPLDRSLLLSCCN